MNLYTELKNRWPLATDEQLEELLWITPYPCTSGENVVIILDKIKAKWGINIQTAIDGEMAEFDAIMKKVCEEARAEEAKEAEQFALSHKSLNQMFTKVSIWFKIKSRIRQFLSFGNTRK